MLHAATDTLRVRHRHRPMRYQDSVIAGHSAGETSTENSVRKRPRRRRELSQLAMLITNSRASVTTAIFRKSACAGRTVVAVFVVFLDILGRARR